MNSFSMTGAEARKLAHVIAAGMVLCLGLGGCSAAGSAEAGAWDCTEEVRVSEELSRNEIFNRTPDSISSTPYRYLPCDDNSGVTIVVAGQQYLMRDQITFEDLRQIGASMAGPEHWEWIEIPSEGVKTRDLYVCYRALARTDSHSLIHLGIGADNGLAYNAARTRHGLATLTVELSRTSESAPPPVETCP